MFIGPVVSICARKKHLPSGNLTELLNAIENDPFIDYLPIKHCDFQ